LKCIFHLLTYNRDSIGILKLVSPDALPVLSAINSQNECAIEVISFCPIVPIPKTQEGLELKFEMEIPH
jgi:hypothetical protein